MADKGKLTATVKVNLGENGYSIYIGENILSEIGEYVKELRVGSRILLVTNPTVRALYGQIVFDSLNKSGFEVILGEIPDGEKYKSLDSASYLYNVAFENNLDRKCAVLALGGGVIGDLAGFVAATYMRGVPFIQVPTTLLAQVDSSVGGKVAVNHPKGKNIIGAFYQPKLVFTDIATLKTLPEREFRAGMAEVIKYGIIWDKEFFSYLMNNIKDINGLKAENIAHIVRTSCAVKARVVEKDEKEEGLRAILNYGHTFGHAYEALTGYKTYLHGEALAIGMVSAAILAVRLGMITDQEEKSICRLLADYGLPVVFKDLSIDDIINKMYYDKKAESGKIKFILPEQIGRVSIYKGLEEDDIKKALISQN